MVYKIIFFISILALQYGCNLLQNSELDKMSKKEIEQYFKKNKSDLQKVVDICEQYPSIMRIEKDRVEYYSKEVSDETKKQIKDIQKIVGKLKINNVQCGRNKQILSNELFGVSFWLYSAGLGVSGEGQLIRYKTKRNRRSSPKNKIPWRTIVPLPEEGWSIVYTK